MSKTDHSRSGGIALEKCYQFLLWLVPTVEKFPKSQKFLLGDRIQNLALDVQPQQQRTGETEQQQRVSPSQYAFDCRSRCVYGRNGCA